jgi:hypothetical protein
MGFSSVFDVKKGTPTASGFGGLFQSLNEEELNRKKRQVQLERDAQTSEREAEYANSFVGLAKETGRELGARALNIPLDFAKSLSDTYSSTPTRFRENIEEASRDIEKGDSEKGLVKAGARTAGDAAIAVFAPLSAAIGSVLRATGGEKLIDDVGRVVADSSGITDIPAFQKFALEHPNAGLDFERLLNLGFVGAEKGSINPQRFVAESQAVAQRLATPRSRPTVEPATVSTPQPFEAIFSEKSAQTIRQVASETVVEGPQRTINTRAATLMEAAVEKKLTEALGELPTHNRINMREQRQSAMDFIENNPSEALRVAKGDALPPKGVLPESIYTAMEIRAMRDGDVATIRELASSKVPTAAGQSFKALDSADPNSPVKILRDIKAVREAKLTKRTAETPRKAMLREVESITKEIRRSASKRETWEEFIQQITCNY